MTSSRSLANEFHAEGQEDYVGLWQLVRAVRAQGVSESSELRRDVLGIAGELLNSGLQAGQFVNGAWEPWALLAEEALRRIEQEWTALARDPDLGEIAWFVAPR